jgi:hypothetical protein
MTPDARSVVIATGASRGIGASLVAGQRDRIVAEALEHFGRVDTLVNDAGVFLPRRTGHIVTITTTLVDRADSRVPAALTVLTKGGLVAATRSLAIEYARHGIRVNAVSPGVIRTATDDPAAYDDLAQLQPLGRVGSISDVVDGVRSQDPERGRTPCCVFGSPSQPIDAKPRRQSARSRVSFSSASSSVIDATM